MKHKRWVAQLPLKDDSGSRIDKVAKAARVSRADALCYFATYHLEDWVEHLKEDRTRSIDEWDG